MVADQQKATREYYKKLYQYWTKPRTIFYKNDNPYHENDHFVMTLFQEQITSDRLNADIIIEVPDFEIPLSDRAQQRLMQCKVSNSIVISFLALQDLKTDWVSVKFQL